MSSRPKQVEVVAVEFLNNAFLAPNPIKRKTLANFVVEVPFAAGASEQEVTLYKTGATTCVPNESFGYGTAVVTNSDPNVIELYEWSLYFQARVLNDHGGTTHHNIVFYPVLMRGAQELDVGTGQVTYSTSVAFKALPCQKTVALDMVGGNGQIRNDICIKGSGVVAIRNENPTVDSRDLAMGVTIKNTSNTTGHTVDEMFAQFYLRRWNEDLPSSNPNKGG